MGTLAEKLRSGLLELSTETGPLYASPSISERIYLLWTFRNFRRLPQQVLNSRQRQLIDKLCRASTPGQHRPAVTLPIIGTVENVHPVSQRKPVVAASASKVVARRHVVCVVVDIAAWGCLCKYQTRHQHKQPKNHEQFSHLRDPP